ncbi:MAG: PEP/pyruvate-binding domain-containing protein, partial [Thermoanaerobaculia bacterium]|nr:PEP/pyruvate-binding domain-containing protein [Thermoanaerobaculia bacterium]
IENAIIAIAITAWPPYARIARAHLVEVLREARRRTNLGQVAELSRTRFAHDLISRTDQGALGGKGRSIAFLYRSLSETSLPANSALPVNLPKSVIVTTDLYDDFLDSNDLRKFAAETLDDRQVAERFIAAPLPARLTEDLEFLIDRLEGPLAVRSSSLLEDSLHQPFAGVYSTFMIPNQDPDHGRRMEDLATAIRLLYASTFSRHARSYLNSTGHLIEEEKMAVIIQPVIGRRYGRRFYPTFSGVAQSYNFYPIGPQRPRDGIIHVALGLGRMVVDGGLALRFSPRHPRVLPQFATPKAFLDRSQRTFYALDLDAPCCRPGDDPFTNLGEYDLAVAEEDGVLSRVASVYSASDRVFREDLGLPGPRVVSFANILKHDAIPLAETLRAVLKVAEEGTGGPVEIEFACEMGEWGAPRRGERAGPELTLLQMRPFGARQLKSKLPTRRFAPGQVLCRSTRALGHGLDQTVHDLIYVRPDAWRPAANRGIAAEVDELARLARAEDRPFVLIGPGRWGTADESLGIPVRWGQIAGARVIVEASPEGYDIEPSQGTHFFQNMTALEVGYLTLPPGADAETGAEGNRLDWAWLDRQPALRETEHLRLLRFDRPLTVVLDGRKGVGVIVKPGHE